MLQASDDFWADEHETFVDVAAQDIKESAQHIPQQTNGAGAEATLPPDCLECAFGSCCDRPGPVADGSCFEQRR